MPTSRDPVKECQRAPPPALLSHRANRNGGRQNSPWSRKPSTVLDFFALAAQTKNGQGCIVTGTTRTHETLSRASRPTNDGHRMISAIVLFRQGSGCGRIALCDAETDSPDGPAFPPPLGQLARFAILNPRLGGGAIQATVPTPKP